MVSNLKPHVAQNDLSRFLGKYQIDANGCWRWTGSKMHAGYGQFHSHRQDGTKQNERAHRFAFRALKGPLIEGLVIDHICNVRDCVNPDHLQQITNKENVLRGDGHTAVNARKTHCKNGHELTEANVYRIRGERWCRQCRREDNRIRKRARRIKNKGNQP